MVSWLNRSKLNICWTLKTSKGCLYWIISKPAISTIAEFNVYGERYGRDWDYTTIFGQWAWTSAKQWAFSSAKTIPLPLGTNSVNLWIAMECVLFSKSSQCSRGMSRKCWWRKSLSIATQIICTACTTRRDKPKKWACWKSCWLKIRKKTQFSLSIGSRITPSGKAIFLSSRKNLDLDTSPLSKKTLILSSLPLSSHNTNPYRNFGL